ncbi:unnamed protein product, partial [Polarella glacialis]
VALLDLLPELIGECPPAAKDLKQEFEQVLEKLKEGGEWTQHRLEGIYEINDKLEELIERSDWKRVLSQSGTAQSLQMQFSRLQKSFWDDSFGDVAPAACGG